MRLILGCVNAGLAGLWLQRAGQESGALAVAEYALAGLMIVTGAVNFFLWHESRVARQA